MTETTLTVRSKLIPHSLKNAPSLIEKLLPAQKISAEAQKERKGGQGQTLTALGSYWKGRKPLVLNKACILGCLLPATDDLEKDLEIYEKLMGIADEAFPNRVKAPKDKSRIVALPYLDRLSLCYRPEEVPDAKLYGHIWKEVNNHLGTSAESFSELVEQLGIMRFGRRPRFADTFTGSGQIPFEAARLGCDVSASDLNPVACLLTWAARNITGADADGQKKISDLEHKIANDVHDEIVRLGIEEDADGNRAKAFLYCIETRCPQTGWIVPMLGTRVISKGRNIYADLVPDFNNKRFNIKVVTAHSEQEMVLAESGTVQDECLVYTLEGEEYRTPVATLRGDYKVSNVSANKLRRWEKRDFIPHPDDIFQERLYAIQWITKESLRGGREQTFFAAATDADLKREKKVEEIVAQHLEEWQSEGFVPDMPMEPGDKTDEPIRTRGWTYWHHLFGARHLLILQLFLRKVNQAEAVIPFAAMLDMTSKLCRWTTSGKRYAKDGSGKQVGGASDNPSNVFSNQALNPIWNYAIRAGSFLCRDFPAGYKHCPLPAAAFSVKTLNAADFAEPVDIAVTDPPYADAVVYHEITEFFIAWLRKHTPQPLSSWTWDSRRLLAIKGSGDDFRRDMTAAYKALAQNMADNGIQVVMFTHQDTDVWADMAAIMWGSGLQVTAAWYIATETTSELKKGGYVQGTVLLVLRKRVTSSSAYRDELVQEVQAEVVRQIDTLVGLNQSAKGSGRSENLFEDADLQMAGYAAALRVLTGYTHIDGKDMTAEALRPQIKGEKGVVGEIIDFAVQVANEHLVPEGLSASTWDALNGFERFYLKMMDIESVGLKKLDNYQNFAKAFRVSEYTSLMASLKANDARLKTSAEFKKSQFDGEFGQSRLRALLFALFELQKEVDSDEVMTHLRDLVANYHTHRENLMSLAQYIANKRATRNEAEAEAARILHACIRNERLGG